jgi:hypothetical protein
MVANNYKAEKIDVQSVVIVNFNRQVVTDIKRQLVDFNVYEDIFAPTMTFSATLLDSNGLIERFPFIGEELIAVSFKIPTVKKTIDKVFSIYKVSNRKEKEERNESYTLHGVSLESIVDLNASVDNSFVGLPFSEMIKSTYKEYFINSPKKVGAEKFLTYEKKLFVEDTYGNHSVVSPMSRPFEFIQYCAKQSQSSKYKESDYIFYENDDGFNFRTISSLLEQEPVEDYYSADPAKSKNQNDKVKEHQMVREISYDDREFDVFESVTTGFYDNDVAVIDPVLKRFQNTSLNYHYTKDFTNLNKNKFTSNFAVYKQFDGSSHSRYIVSNLSSGAYNQTSYIKGKSTGDPVAQHPFVRHKFLNHLVSKISQINTKLVLRIVIPGDPNRKAGDIVRFFIPQKSGSQEFSTRYNFFYGEKDPRFLVTAVHHNYSYREDTYMTTLEIVKDSFGQQIFNREVNSLGGIT